MQIGQLGIPVTPPAPQMIFLHCSLMGFFKNNFYYKNIMLIVEINIILHSRRWPCPFPISTSYEEYSFSIFLFDHIFYNLRLWVYNHLHKFSIISLRIKSKLPYIVVCEVFLALLTFSQPFVNSN